MDARIVIAVAIAITIFFFLAPVVPLIPGDRTDVLAGYGRWAAYYSYTNLTMVYWSHVTYPSCAPGVVGCPAGFSNSTSPEYLPMPTYGLLSYYFLGSGGLYFNVGYTVAVCAGNSSADVYCYVSVPCLNGNIPWPHDSCF